jgi:ribose 5-phosphate isomerase B
MPGEDDVGPEREVVDEAGREVLTGSEVGHLPVGTVLQVREGVLITPLAADLIKARQLTLRFKPRPAGRGIIRTIALASDHGGFAMKDRVALHLRDLGYAVRDFGAFSEEPVDYPDIAHAVARAVADHHCDVGILLDAAGIGSCIAANKVPGVRAAMCYDVATARSSREHNYANVLTLGARLLSEGVILELVTVWLTTPEGEARHGRRVGKITAIEQQYLRR